MKGREDARWGKRVTEQPLDSVVRQLAFAGFSGIYIDRYGYKDSGLEIESQLSQLLRESPLVSQNARLAFFSLTSLTEWMRARYTPEQWSDKHDQALRLGASSSSDALLHSLRVQCKEHHLSAAQCHDLVTHMLNEPAASP